MVWQLHGYLDMFTRYVLAILWHERRRFVAAVLAVAFSGVLIALQCGLLLGLFSITSIPVDRAAADIWVAAPQVLSVDLGRPIGLQLQGRLASDEDVVQAEVYIQGFNYWTKPRGGSQLCTIVAGRLEDDGLSVLGTLSRDLRERLTEPGTIVIDESEMHRLGVEKVGETAEIMGNKVRVIGMVRGLPCFAGPYVFCSIRTARPLLQLELSQTRFLLARCRPGVKASDVAERLRRFDDMTVYTKHEFSLRTRLHWLMTTKAGIALGFSAVLGLLVGAVITSQTLYSATVASFKEYATLEALGIPRWRIALVILVQAFWIGVGGIALALPLTLGLAGAAEVLQVHVQLPALLMGGTAAVTLGTALIAGLAATRSLRFINVYALLH